MPAGPANVCSGIARPSAPNSASMIRCETSAAQPHTGRGYSAKRNVPRGRSTWMGAKQPELMGTSAKMCFIPQSVEPIVVAHTELSGPRHGGLLRE